MHSPQKPVIDTNTHLCLCIAILLFCLVSVKCCFGFFSLSISISEHLVLFTYFFCYSPSENKVMELEKYDLIEMIGNGSYGKVFRAKEKATGKSIAVKLIKKVSVLFSIQTS